MTLRLEDGLPAGGHAVPITIVVPITGGSGEAGAALAAFQEYGPHTIDGSGLRVAGDRMPTQRHDPHGQRPAGLED